MNIMHPPPSPGGAPNEFRRTPPDDAAARAAAVVENGAELFAADARSQFERDNPGLYQAQRDHAHASGRREEARRAARQVEGQLARTYAKHVVIRVQRSATRRTAKRRSPPPKSSSFKADGDPQAFPAPATAVAARHVGGGPGLVDEDEPLRAQVQLAIEPGLALLQDIGAVLLDRVRGLFSK